MKPNLIYLICFGSYIHRKMCEFCIMSILDRTNFAGDIVVLSDSNVITTDLLKLTKRVRIINVFDHFPELRAKIKDKFNIYCVKPLITQILDISKYNFVLYLDCDVLIDNKNFNEMFTFWAACGQIQLLDNGKWRVDKNVPSTGSDILTRDEKKNFSRFGVCAGVVGFPGNELGLGFCTKWNELNEEGFFEKDDQGNLTALIIRNYYNNYKYLDFINTNRYIIKNITHYHKKYKKQFWDHCKFLLRRYETRETRLIGKWLMKKPAENMENTWEFTETMVFVDNPNITGQIQHTIFGTYVWWQTLEGGFEKVRVSDLDNLSGDSYNGGEACFSLSKIS